jgi:Tol biopolymer transport system component
VTADPGYRLELPAWSPDSRYIAFVRVPQLEAWRGARIFTTRADDGSGTRQITRSSSATNLSGDLDPSWGPIAAP